VFEDASLARTTVQVNTAVRLVEEHARLNLELEQILATEPPPAPQRAGTRAHGPSDAVLAKTAEVEAIEARMEGSWVDVTLQAVAFNIWRDFKEANPPTELADDQQFGVNLGAVVTDMLPECWVDPPMDEPSWERALGGGIWPGDLEALAKIVTRLHGRNFSVPKSRLTLAVRQTLEGLSEPPELSESPNAVSTGGNRKSGKTTTTRKAATPATR
jgi:hypothetical protein